MTEHQRGLLLGSFGVLAIIPDATLIRLIDAPSLTTSMWRAGLQGVGISAFLVWRYRTRLPRVIWAMGPWGVVASAWSALGTILFVAAIDRTSVANVVLILALTPLWAAIITRLVTGATIPARTLLAMPFAFVGVAIAVGGSLDGGVNAGDVTALCTSLGLAANMTIIRARTEVDMVPTAALGGFLGCGVLAMVGTSASLTPGDLGPLLLLGLGVLPLASGLLTAGARYLSSPELTLLLLGETAASPLLAAVVVEEPLESGALLGGSIVLVTLFLHGWLGLRSPTGAKMPA